VTETYDPVFCAHALQTKQVRVKSVNNEGHCTLEPQTVFRPYLPSHCIGVTDISYISFRAHALQAVLVRLKLVSNEGHFTLEAEIVFLPISPRIVVG
jgi:hypothetical protein